MNFSMIKKIMLKEKLKVQLFKFIFITITEIVKNNNINIRQIWIIKI